MFGDGVSAIGTLKRTNLREAGNPQKYRKGKTAMVALAIFAVGAFLFVYSILCTATLGGSIQASLGKNSDILAGRLEILALTVGGLHTLYGACRINRRLVALSRVSLRSKLDLAVRVTTFVTAIITLVLGALYLSPQKIINLRQLGYGLIGSLVVPTALSMIHSIGNYIDSRLRTAREHRMRGNFT